MFNWRIRLFPPPLQSTSSHTVTVWSRLCSVLTFLSLLALDWSSDLPTQHPKQHTLILSSLKKKKGKIISSRGSLLCSLLLYSPLEHISVCSNISLLLSLKFLQSSLQWHVLAGFYLCAQHLIRQGEHVVTRKFVVCSLRVLRRWTLQASSPAALNISNKVMSCLNEGIWDVIKNCMSLVRPIECRVPERLPYICSSQGRVKPALESIPMSIFTPMWHISHLFHKLLILSFVTQWKNNLKKHFRYTKNIF